MTIVSSLTNNQVKMSSDNTNDMSSNLNKSIPLLDSTNFNQWYLRIQSYFKHKNLLKYCLESPNDTLSGAAENNVNSKKAETVVIIMNHISVEAFDAVINADNSDEPYLIWQSILNRYASQSFNNKARIWLKFMRLEWNGNLMNFIQECKQHLNEIALVKLGVPANVLCYSILAKLPRSMWTFVEKNGIK